MNSLDQERRMICKKCRKVFDIGDAAITYREYGGAKMRDKVCPHCGGGFRAVDLSTYFDKYLDVNNDIRYYEYQ